MNCPRTWLVVFLATFAVHRVAAQAFTLSDTLRHDDFVSIGSPASDRIRVLEVLGAIRATLVRSSTVTGPLDTSRRVFRWRPINPYVEITWNSTLPYSLNDGAQWAGRGLTLLGAGGIAGRVARVHFQVVPQIWRTQNAPFPIIPGGDSVRSAFASPWFNGRSSVDLPTRFGYLPTTAVDLGETALWMDAAGAAFGFSNETQWWGPGIRNAIVLSNNAGGFPHAFLRTARPVARRVGTFEGKWIAGVLSESRFFDDVRANNLRSLSGAVGTFSPAMDSNLTVGIARVVYSRIPSAGSLSRRAFDVITRKGGEKVRTSTGLASEQLTSLFGRWLLPGAAAEIYGEWARILLPTSLRAFLLAPEFTQGYTLGAQWLPAVSARDRLRIQLEFSNLEQSPTSAAADTISFYASTTVAQGYTERGQALGAAIGPGSSSQWLAVDVLRASRTAGIFIGRVRWNADAYYRQPNAITSFSYDVSVLAGIRGAARVLGRDLGADVTWQHRLNYLFQNSLYGYSDNDVFDRYNTTIRLRVY